MRFFPKKHFQWREPKAFLKLSDTFERSERRWWTQLLWTAVATALLMSNWFLAKLNPQNGPPGFVEALGLALLGGVFFVYCLPWIISLCPSEIRLFDAHLVRMRGDTQLHVKYGEIHSFAWGEHDEFRTLVLKCGKKQRAVFLGVPPEVSHYAVTKFLLNQGVREQPEGAHPQLRSAT
jgi:hypothetical protein